MINNKNNSSLQISEHIKSYITINIQSNKWPAGLKIPSERQLSIKFGTTTTTVRKVISKFVENRIIEPRFRKGYFVCEENILSPGDILGLKLEPNLKITFEEPEQETFDNYDMKIFKEIIDLKLDGKYKFFRKITKKDNETIKVAVIGIDKEKYETNIEVAKEESNFNNTFNVKIFNALTGDLIAKKIDVITSPENSENSEYNDSTRFHSVTLDKNNKPIELAVTYVKKEYFNFKRVTQIK